ncbi:hypothetical protein D3C71_1480200 [compost metagenome]
MTMPSTTEQLRERYERQRLSVVLRFIRNRRKRGWLGKRGALLRKFCAAQMPRGKRARRALEL